MHTQQQPFNSITLLCLQMRNMQLLLKLAWQNKTKIEIVFFLKDAFPILVANKYYMII